MEALDHLVREDGIGKRETGARDEAMLQDVVDELLALVGRRDA